MTRLMAAALISGVGLSACAGMGSEPRISPASSGAALNAIVPGVSIADGAVAGSAIGGLVNAVWADQNNDGYVDGYVQNGEYYAGTPRGYDPSLHRVVVSAASPTAAGAMAPLATSSAPAMGAPAPMTSPEPASSQPMASPAPPAPRPARGERG